MVPLVLNQESAKTMITLIDLKSDYACATTAKD